MNTKHLKARILDLALQGKLVENSRIPNDLNSRIPTDFNPPFKIPNSWAWVNFKDIFQILNIKSSLQQKSINKTGKFPVITQSNNFIEGYFDDEKLLINLEQNDLIVFGDHTKNVKFVNIPFIVGADGVKLIKPKPNINSKFAYHLLCFASYNTINRGYSRHFQFIKNFIYPLPPKDEQERIVKKIDELFSQIDILDKHKESLLKNIKHTKARILDLALQGKLVENSRIPNDLNSRIPTDFNPPFKIPNSWAWVNFKDIFQILNIKSSLQQKSINKTGKFPVITQSNNFIEGYFDDEKLLINLEQNDLIVFGDHTKNVKFVNIPFIVGADGVKLIKPKPNINSKFAYHLLCFASYNTINRGYSRHFQFIKNFIYPLPPKDEQERIVKKIDELFEILEVIENSL